MALTNEELPKRLPQTDPRFYLRRAARWAKAYISGPNDAADTLNLYDVSGLAHYELYRTMGLIDHPRLAVTPGRLLADMRKQLKGAVQQGTKDPFGFGFRWDTWDTTAHGAGLAVMAADYDQLTQSQDFAAYGQGWLGNILGANAWGSSFIVGDGAVFPHCLQDQVANRVGSLEGGAPVLAGAAVEGPNGSATRGSLPGMKPCPTNGEERFARFDGHGAEWRDNVQSYSNTEPAIDLSAASPLAFAQEMAGRI